MNVYVKGGLGAAFLILGLVAAWFAYAPLLAANRNPEQFELIARMEKDGAPDFELNDLDGRKVRLSSLRGKVVIVNFWASWCNPCVEEFPSLIKLVEHFKGAVALIAVSNDEDVADIRTFLSAFGMKSFDKLPGARIVWDKGRNLADRWGVSKIPESYLLGKDGKLVRKVMGTENWATDGAFGYFEDLIKAGG